MRRKKGADWKSKVFFYSESSGKGIYRSYTISEDDLKAQMEELCGLSEKGTAVSIYKVPLSERQPILLRFLRFCTTSIRDTQMVVDNRKGWTRDINHHRVANHLNKICL